MVLRETLGLVGLALVAGCSSTDGNGPPPSEVSKHDETLTVHFDTAANSVAPGAETMTCEYMAPLDRDLVVTGFGTKQAKGGHHMVLYRSIAQKPAGTVEDCTQADSMTNLLLALTQITTQAPGSASIEFPQGMVVVLPKGTQLVTQSHYINTTTDALVANDQVDIWTTESDPAEFDVLHLFVANSASFEIPAHASSYSARAGCTLAHDVDLVSLVPHMHQWGTALHLKIGAPDSMNFVIDVTGWQPGWRDVAPITTFLEGDALSEEGHYSAGQSVELQCTWANDEARALKFPDEMCAVAGYYLSDDEGAADVMCLTPL
jgi:hypothetical protein